MKEETLGIGALEQDSVSVQSDHKRRIPGDPPPREVKAPPADFIPLDQETRTHVTTKVMCYHLGRKEQTARGWASAETFPEGLRPIRIHGRLAWPVVGIRHVLGLLAYGPTGDAK